MFQFTHPGGVRHSISVFGRTYRLFQFTHPGGVRRRGNGSLSVTSLFQFTHPGGVRRFTGCGSVNLSLFQFTHPGGVRLTRCKFSFSPAKFQFTHPGGVRLFLLPSAAIIPCFNSRTREGCDTSSGEWVTPSSLFQFTHPGGVRRCIMTFTVVRTMFQFTHPGGVRHLNFSGGEDNRLVSIHAPGRGATASGLAYYPFQSSFNSRTREGCDRYASLQCYRACVFQFTHPGGVRLDHNCV